MSIIALGAKRECVGRTSLRNRGFGPIVVNGARIKCAGCLLKGLKPSEL